MNQSLFTITLDRMLDEHARSYPGRVAVTEGSDRRLTFPQLRDRVNQLANAMAEMGLGEGERVLWLGQNSLSVLEGVLACARIGAIFCPVNWRQSAAELAFVIDDLSPELVIWQAEEIGDAVREAIDLAEFEIPNLVQFDSEEGDSYESLLQTQPTGWEEKNINVNLPVVAMYTAAFEGKPNAALMSQRAYIAQALIMSRIIDFSHRTVYLNSGPLFHIGTLGFTLTSFVVGGANAFLRRTDAEAMCRIIDSEKCTYAFIVGKTMQEMAELNKHGKYDLKSLRSLSFFPEWDEMVTVEPQPEGYMPFAGYGQTEVQGLATWQFYGGASQGFFGRPSPLTQVRLHDSDDNEVPQGEVGELVIRGPLVMNGYWNRPQINAWRHKDGWHHTNDLGRLEADGSYTFIGPKIQMIKSGVENIYPAEVEACLKTHEAVADAAVIGVPDETWIQNVKAIVQLEEGMLADPEVLIAHCQANIASYKKPKSVEFVDTIPRKPDFSIDYASLDEQFGGGGYPGGDTPSL